MSITYTSQGTGAETADHLLGSYLSDTSLSGANLAQLESARDKGVEALLRRQHPNGWWKGDLESNASIEAEDLLLRHFLGITDPEILTATAKWLRHRQRPDGTWAAFHGGPADLSITTEAYVALKLAGDPTDSAHMISAREFILDSGGLESTRVFTRIWMALFGEWPWDELPTLLPEMILLPKWCPLNVYDFACWARQTIVPLTVVGAYRPVRPLPFDIQELRTGAMPPERAPRAATSLEGVFFHLDKAMHLVNRAVLSKSVARPLREHALRQAERWIVERQEADGSWGGIQPPWVYSLLALNLRGYPIDHPLMVKSLAGLDSFEVREGDMRWLECCQSPVWDTALAVVALGDAGVSPDDPAMLAAAEWLLAEEVQVKGDWSVRRPKLDPGGWAFEFENDNYPDTDDTAEVGLALTKVAASETDRADMDAAMDAALRRAIVWVEGMQCSDGGYAAFDVDNNRKWGEYLPFCDFGEVIDPPSADVTAHVIEMLCHLKQRFGGGAAGSEGDTGAGADVGAGEGDTVVDDGVNGANGGSAHAVVDELALERAFRWLLRAQESDGSWFGRWGSNYIYGTGAAVPALIAAGISPRHPVIAKAVEFLHSTQNPDGGWGEDMRSYTDLSYKAKGESTASQTAWALLALVAAQELGEPALRGAAWLAETQLEDGTWDEPWFTGTGFPGDFLINYHLYRDVFPVTALGRIITALANTSLNAPSFASTSLKTTT